MSKSGWKIVCVILAIILSVVLFANATSCADRITQEGRCEKRGYGRAISIDGRVYCLVVDVEDNNQIYGQRLYPATPTPEAVP